MTSPRPIPLGSMFTNLAALVRDAVPRSGSALLGARWSFEWPAARATGRLCEYSLPPGYTAAVARRTGVRIDARRDGDGLYEHVARGGSAIVAVDSHALPYRPAYGRVHSHRTVLVRPGPSPDTVLVDDRWPPTHAGPLVAAVLEQARHSSVPLDPVAEPVFAGAPVSGEWWTVAVDALTVDDLAEWAAGLVSELCDEGHAGIAGLRMLAEHVTASAVSGDEWQRRAEHRLAALVLRSELGARAHLCLFLAAASGWIGDPLLERAAGQYAESLGAMAQARDVLTKSLTHGWDRYSAYVVGRLSAACVAEERLAEALRQYAAEAKPRSPSFVGPVGVPAKGAI